MSKLLSFFLFRVSSFMIYVFFHSGSTEKTLQIA